MVDHEGLVKEILWKGMHPELHVFDPESAPRELVDGGGSGGEEDRRNGTWAWRLVLGTWMLSLGVCLMILTRTSWRSRFLQRGALEKQKKN